MSKLRSLLAQATEKLGLNQPLLARAQRRYKANRKRAYQAHNQQVKAQESADRARAKGFTELAEKRDREAARHGHVAYHNHLRAQHYLGVVKKLTQRIEGLESQRDLSAEEIKKPDTVQIRGNKATGGSKRHRLKAVALLAAKKCAAGQRRNFYSQIGAWDVDHCITGESYGERSDCSSWVTSVYRSCGLPDPNGERYTGGYTGTLGANGNVTNDPKPGDLVLYGSYPHHHVEMFVGPGDKTIGHGSAPVDPGVIDLFGDGDYTIRTYV